MADRIKGITIEIDGETTGLKKALSSITSESINIQRNLKDVNKLLKLDPGNTELITQKQKLLSEAIETTKEKLNKLKDAQEQVNQQFTSGKINESQYQGFQREIAETEIKLKDLESTLKNVSPEIAKIGAEMESSGKKMKTIGDGMKDVGSTLSTHVTLPIVGIGAAAIKTGNDFESGMSRVKAISGATGDEFDKLKQQALDLGQSTAFSATEVATAQENLASAGFTVSETMKALPGLLDLAASSGEDLSTSSDIAASTLRGFGLEADQAGHVADVLAKNAADTNAAVADTGEAMKYVAPAAHAAGISLEETTAAIGIMANSGIQGSQAGTTLRGVLTRLAKPSSEAAKAMESMGFNAFDSEGKMKSLSEIISGLQNGMAGMTDEQKQNTIATVFGQEAMSGMLTLIDAGGEQINTLADGLKNADGAASDMAKTMQDNTGSAIEQMFGALETAGIKIQEALAPAIKAIANVIGDLATAFSNLPSGVQTVIVAILALVAVIGPILVIVGSIISAIGTITAGLGALAAAGGIASVAASALGAAIAFITSPITLTVAAITALVAGVVLLYNKCEWFRNGVNSIFETIKTTISGYVDFWVNVFTVSIPGAIDTFIDFFQKLPENVSLIWQTVTDALTTAWDSIVTFFAESVPQWLESMFNWFGELPNKIGYGLGLALGSVVKWGGDVIDYLTTNVPKWIESIGNWFAELPGKVWEWLTKVVTDLGTWGTSVINWITTTVPTWIDNIVNYFKELPGKIWEWLVKVVTDIGTWGGDMLSKATEACGEVKDGILDVFEELPGKMLEVGENLVKGLWNGIINVKDWILGKIGDFADSVVDGFKDAFNINSPSKRMADEIGKYIPQGVSVGINDEIPKMNRSIGRSLDSAMNTVTSSAIQSSGNLSNINYNNKFDEIINKLEVVAEAVNISIDGDSLVRKTSKRMSNQIAFNQSRRL